MNGISRLFLGTTFKIFVKSLSERLCNLCEAVILSYMVFLCAPHVSVVHFLPYFPFDWLTCSSFCSHTTSKMKTTNTLFLSFFYVSQASTPVSRTLSHWAGVSAVPPFPWVEGCVAPPCPWEGACVAPLSPQDSFHPTPRCLFHQSTLCQTHRYVTKRGRVLFASVSANNISTKLNDTWSFRPEDYRKIHNHDLQ